MHYIQRVYTSSFLSKNNGGTQNEIIRRFDEKLI